MGLTVNISNRLLTHVHNKTSPIEQKAIKLWQFGEAPPTQDNFYHPKDFRMATLKKELSLHTETTICLALKQMFTTKIIIW